MRCSEVPPDTELRFERVAWIGALTLSKGWPEKQAATESTFQLGLW